MKNLSVLTQSLANIYPEWSQVRFDEQSLGQRFLNCLATPLERAAKELVRASRNFHLTTANLNEIDLIYIIELDADHEFASDSTDPFNPVDVAPTVSGIVDGTSYAVTIAEQNDLETFWYCRTPDRISAGSTASGNFVLLSGSSEDTPFESVLTPHMSGKLYVELSGTERLLYIDDEDVLHRAVVKINGKTRKGTYETEALAFPWHQKQATMKEWESIDSIQCCDVPSGTNITVCSADFINGPYMDFWNMAYSAYRHKVDSFWDLGSNSHGSTLDMIRYTTDDIQQMLDGIYDMYVARSFELLDESGNNVTALDMAQQPFTDYLWVVSSGQLFCYDSHLTTGSDATVYREATADNGIALVFSEDHPARDSEVDVELVCQNPGSPVNKFRAWVKLPDATYSGIHGGQFVVYDSSEYHFVSYHEYNIDTRLTFTPDTLGEYVFGLEAEMTDGTTQIAKRVMFVDSKEPLVQFDLPSGIVQSGVLGIEFNSDQDMWIATQSGYHKINLHHDVMLIDYENKVLFVREEYDEVEIW